MQQAVPSLFLRDIFGDVSEGLVYVASLPNSDAPEAELASGEKRLASRDMEAIDRFCSKWDRAHRGLFMCVGTVKPGTTRKTKENLQELVLLHSDIDLKDVHGTIDEVVTILQGLFIRPSIIVLSGHGVHAYWLLREAVLAEVDTIEAIEAALRQLSGVVAGDAVCCQASCYMRLPGTHNSKGGAWTPVTVVESNMVRHEFDDVVEWLDWQGPVIQRKAKDLSIVPQNPFLAAAARLGFKPPIDVEQRLEAMSFQGQGDSAIHATQLAVSAALLNRGSTENEVADILLAATRAAAGPFADKWNWRREERAIRRMCTDWLRKNPTERTSPCSQAKPNMDEEQPAAEGRATGTGGATVVNLSDARKKKPKDPKEAKPPRDKQSIASVVADGVIEAIRQNGQDILLTEGDVFIYADGIWHVMTPADQQWIQTLIQEGHEVLGEPGKVSNLTAAWKRLCEHPGLFKRTVEWNKSALITCDNGMLNPETLEFSEHAPEHFSRRKIGTSYQPQASCPRFERFIESLFANRLPADRVDIVRVFQEYVGASMAVWLLFREERKAMILSGPSRSGKTELSRIVRLLIGGHIATPSVAETAERFGLASLFDASAWIRDDAINEGDNIDPQRFKTIVTGEPIDIERKHLAAVRGVELTIPVLLTTNSLPRARDKSDAIFNRAIVLEMTNVITEEDAQRLRNEMGIPRGRSVGIHIFAEEGPGILNWALVGLGRLMERGSYALPECIRNSIQRFKDDNNPVAEWARSALKPGPHKVQRNDLLCAFHGWQREQDGDDARALGGRGFFPRLRACLPALDLEVKDKIGRRFVGGASLTDEGLYYWERHNSDPLRGGSKGASTLKTEVNKAWHARENDVEDDPNAPRF